MGYLGAASDFDEGLAKKLKLSRTDMRCLDLIGRHGPLTAGRLAQEAGLTTGAVTFILDRLEEAGMVAPPARHRGPPSGVGRDRARGRRSASRTCNARWPRRCDGSRSTSSSTSSLSCATTCARPKRSSSARCAGAVTTGTDAEPDRGGRRRPRESRGESRLAWLVPGRDGRDHAVLRSPRGPPVQGKEARCRTSSISTTRTPARRWSSRTSWAARAPTWPR